MYQWIVKAREILQSGGKLSIENFATESLSWDEDNADQYWQQLP